MKHMTAAPTAIDIHSEAIRAFNEAAESCGDHASVHDLRIAFAAAFAAILGLPPSHQTRRLPLRFTTSDVRQIVHPILERHIGGNRVIELMHDIDNAIALASHPAARDMSIR